MKRRDFFAGVSSTLISGVAATRAYSFLNGAGVPSTIESLRTLRTWTEAEVTIGGVRYRLDTGLLLRSGEALLFDPPSGVFNR